MNITTRICHFNYIIDRENIVVDVHEYKKKIRCARKRIPFTQRMCLVEGRDAITHRLRHIRSIVS